MLAEGGGLYSSHAIAPVYNPTNSQLQNDVQCTSCINSVLFYLLSYYRCTDFFTYKLTCVQTYLLIITGEQDGCSPGEQVDDGVSGDDVCGGLQRPVLGHSPSEGTGATQLWRQK